MSILVLDEESAIGITLISCYFIFFNYSESAAQKTGKMPKPIMLSLANENGYPMENRPKNVNLAIRVSSHISRQLDYIVVATES